MLIKEKSERNTLEMVSLEGLVPQVHLLRKIDCAVDFTHIYDFVVDLYCADNGRPSVDPVVLFKMVLIQHLYGIPSLRRTVEEINMNIAYRWFLGYLLNEPVPHFATISYNFRHRFSEDTIEKVFTWILFEAQKSGYLSPEVVFMDGTHIKANANINKKMKKAIPSAAKAYEEQLMQEINEDRMAHGKKPFDGNSGGGEDGGRETTVSTTDPESGMFRKGDHKHCFAYEAHTVCDRHNFILDTVVTSGNVHDSVAFDALYEKVTARFSGIRIVTMDAGYKTPWICKRIIDDGRIPSLPYKRPMTKKGFHEWYKYVYDEYLDIVICPEYKSLLYSTTNRKGYSAISVCHMWNKAFMHGEQGMPENSDASYLGGLHRTGGRHTAFTTGKRKLPPQVADDREGICRRKRKIRNAVYALPWTKKSQYVGKAEICCHEPEETGDVEVESRLPPIFYHNKCLCFKKNPCCASA